MAKDSRSKSKAAQETARLKAEREAAKPKPTPSAPAPEGLPPAEQERSGGMMTRMRSGFQSVAGGGKAKKNKVLDILLWIAVIAAAIFFFARRM